MRILQIVEATGGGVGRHGLDLCEKLVERGHEVHLAYSPRRMEPWFEERLDQAEGLHRVPIDMHRPPHPRDAEAVVRLTRYLRHQRPFHLVHGHSSKGGAMARICGALTGVTSVYTPNAFRTQDPELSGLGKTIYREVELALATLGGEIIAVSGDEKQHARGLGLPPRRLHVVYNGVALDRTGHESISRKELNIPEDAVIVGAVGRLAHQKAPERLLQTLHGIDRERAHLVIVGDGPQRDQLESEAAALGIAERTHFLGARDGLSMMALFDLLLLPSRYEGLPYVLLEALLCGLPIVVSDVGGAREAVLDGINGFVVDEGDTTALIDSVQRLVDSDALRQQMSAAALQRAPLFSLERMVDKTLEVYASALDVA